MDWRDYIDQNPEIMMGKPCIKGTRLTVELILDKLGAGVSFEELMDSYPGITPEQIRATQSFAAAYLSFDKTVWEPAAG